MPDNNDDLVRLPMLYVELRDDGYEPKIPYRRFAEAARDGLYRATLHRGQWYGRRSDRHEIATAMGMRKQRSTSAKREAVTTERFSGISARP